MKQRIEIIIKELKLTRKEFAQSLGVSQSAIGDFLNGRLKSISTDVVANIYKTYNVNPAWLLTGEGEMFISPQIDKRESDNHKETNTIKNGHLSGMNGGVEMYEGDIDHVRWFKKLSREKQTAILAIAEIEDDEYIDEVKGSSLFKLRQERNAAKLRDEENKQVRKKGEAG